MTTTTPPTTPLKKGLREEVITPPPYSTAAGRTHTTNGLLELAPFHTLTSSQLTQFDDELLGHTRRWLSVPQQPATKTMPEELCDWLRGWGFFVALDTMEYRRRALDGGRPLAERAAWMRASCVLGAAGGKGEAEWWGVVGEVLEVRGLEGVV
ncbi:uncharacterized protein LAJ45_11203 [Morchella importuna]|uniref:uncharacterized protein n=1 Tax=Morchella importuna TaxID=1174673 RepID=UPI001E8E6F3D|nr:uncharacterized protein LAJ45_11222 [Morchella importuna]XP_045966111.1 uncharacterized protein LAJ45_11203 [Morchella importuna]KAH8144787.1 hypothetical protein LAJ45_11222 [Morchella importuna]KAH8144807.1 hypothetical protein LAJ45_11203 [Morchella importuna]